MSVTLLQVLKSTAVRNYANGLAYKNPALATDDAMRIGRLHTLLPGEALHASSYLTAALMIHTVTVTVTAARM